MKNLKKFISWIKNHEDFKGLDESQVIDVLNAMSSDKEGKKEVAKLMSEFKQDQKIEKASEVLKASRGMRTRTALPTLSTEDELLTDDPHDMLISEDTDAVPDVEAAKPVYDRNAARQIMIDNGILKKQTRTKWDGTKKERVIRGDNWSRANVRKARAAATEGFDKGDYDFRPGSKIDRDRYRSRMRAARLTPELDTRRERVAFALMDRSTPSFEVVAPMPEIQHTIDTSDFSKFVENLNTDPAPYTPKQNTPQKKAPVVKTTSSDDYWLKKAQPYGFDSLDEVRAWQKQHGLIVDGKFGNNSIAKWHELRRGKVQKDPHGKYGKFNEVAYHPVVSSPESKPAAQQNALENHPNFRRAYSGRLGHSAPTSINIDGVEYPIAVTTGMYGNNLGIENDHTYAYDPNTGKIRKLKEDFTGAVRSSYGFEEGSEWIDMLPAEGWTYKQTGHNMNYGPATYRTAYGRMNK